MSTLDRIHLPDKRILIIAAVTAAVALSFWMGSRIPNLNEKAMMSGAASREAFRPRAMMTSAATLAPHAATKANI